MSFIEIMLILAAIVAVVVLLEKWVRKKLKISKRSGFLYKSTNKMHAWGETIILIIFLVGMVEFTYNESSYSIDKYWMGLFFISLFSFRTLMEWWYARPSREYIVTFWGLIYMVLILVPMYLFTYQ